MIMPTLGALFIAIAVIQFARGYHSLYSTWAYGGLMCLMVSGLLRMFEKFTGQLGWNNPDHLLELAVEPGGLVRECHSARVCRNARGGGRAEVWRTV